MTIHKKLNQGSAFDLNKTQSGCCPDDGTTCRYHYVYDDDATTLTSIVVDGTVIQLGGIDPTGDLSEMINGILDVLYAAGYASDKFKSIDAWRGNDSLNINIFSSVVFGDLVVNPAATITPTINCVTTPLCYYEIEVIVDAAVDFDIEFGKRGDVIGGNVAGDYSTGAGETLEAAILLLLDDTFEGVELQPRIEVIEQQGEEIYSVGIWIYRPNGANLYLDNVEISPVRCSPNYSKLA